MSGENPYGGEQDPYGSQQSVSIAKQFSTEEALLITLIALSAIGIGVTNFLPGRSFWYWAAMAPVFAAVSIFLGWSKARRRGEGMSRIIRVQVLHWAGLLAAIILIYFLLDPVGQTNANVLVNNKELALSTLLALALTTFLAGVHFDWRFMLVGILLGACVAGAAFVEQILWMILIPIAVALFLIIFWWKRKI